MTKKQLIDALEGMPDNQYIAIQMTTGKFTWEPGTDLRLLIQDVVNYDGASSIVVHADNEINFKRRLPEPFIVK